MTYEWQKWPKGSETIFDDFIQQGFEQWGILNDKAFDFFYSGGKKSDYEKLINRAKSLKDNYLTIPAEYFYPYKNWGVEWIRRNGIARGWNDLVELVVEWSKSPVVTDDKKLEFTNQVKMIREFVNRIWILADIANTASDQSLSIVDAMAQFGAKQNPKKNADEYKVWLQNYVFDGAKIFEGVNVDNAITEVMGLISNPVSIVEFPELVFTGTTDDAVVQSVNVSMFDKIKKVAPLLAVGALAFVALT